MSRAARKQRTRSDIENLSLAAMNAAIAESRERKAFVQTGRIAKIYQKEIDLIERVREERFGTPRNE